MDQPHTTSPQYPVWRGILGTVAERCGPDVALNLLQSLGGVTVYVPCKLLEGGTLSKMKPVYAAILIQHFGNETLYVPSVQARSGTHEARFAQKKALFDDIEQRVRAGATTGEIANALGISQTYVFQIRREFDAPKIKDIRNGTLEDRKAKRQALFDKIEPLVREGLNGNEVAKRLNISRHKVYNIRAHFKAPNIRAVHKAQRAAQSDSPTQQPQIANLTGV